jgi:hypothetical protein
MLQKGKRKKIKTKKEITKKNQKGNYISTRICSLGPIAWAPFVFQI